MKILLLLLLPLVTYGQFSIDSISKECNFSQVYELNLDKTKIHDKSEEWIALNFTDSNEVIKLNNENKIIVKGIFEKDQTVGTIKFILSISFKDMKYKLDIKEFTTDFNGQPIPISGGVYSFEDYKAEMYKAYESLPTKMAKKYFLKHYLSQEELVKNHKIAESKKIYTIELIKSKSIAEDLNNFIKSIDNNNW